MSVTRYQALTQDLRVPPLAPAFAEGWQAERAAARAPARNAARDADLFVAAAPAAAAPNGWDAERSFVRAPSRALARDEPPSGTLLKTPPLTGAFAEGWQSERFKPCATGRALARDEQSSMTLLATGPLAPAFPEGWQAERFRPQPTARAVARDEPPSGTLLAAGPLATFREGWAAERCFVRAPRPPVAPYALDFKPAPPAPLSFPEGWVAERAVVPKALRSPVDAATVFLAAGVLATFPEGWQAERSSGPAPAARRRPDEGLPVVPGAAFAEGWQSDAPPARPSPVFRPRAWYLDFAPASPASPREGWQAERARVARTPRGPVDPATAFLAPGQLAPAFREGWQADARALPSARPFRRRPVDLPFAPTAGVHSVLSITDNGDGTGGVATISGSDGSLITVYSAPFAGSLGALSWTAAATRTGDGTAAVAPGLGGFFWYAAGANTPPQFSNFVFQSLSSGAVAPAEVILLADAAAAAVLAAWLASDNPPGTSDAVERVYEIPIADAEYLEALAGRHVWVFPAEYGRTAISRRQDDLHPKIAVVIAERYAGQAPVPTAWLDERVAFVQAAVFFPLADPRRAQLLEGVTPVDDGANVVTYDAELLVHQKLFLSFVVVQYRQQVNP